MQKYILISENKNIVTNSLIEIFQILSEEDAIIIEVGEFSIKYKNKENIEIEAEIGTINFDDSIEKFKESVSNHRQNLRESMSLLIKQGIKLDKTQTEKLAKQFEFLK